MYGCMYPGLYDTMTDTVNSIILAISVAMAAPRTFIAGIPNPPNISTALSTILIHTVAELIIAVVLACSLVFIITR